MPRSLLVILCAVALDAVGIGLIFPTLPRLLEEVMGQGDIALLYGLLLALYSAMQFLFSPLLGALSDRFGRRPVLLLSLAGTAVDYLVLSFSPSLWVLVIGRAVAGITSANMAVAGAYITDITAEKDRAQRFGWMSAAFGVGFIVGPLLGGFLGNDWVRLPFLVAAGLNFLNLLLAVFALPESRTPNEGKLDWAALNPIAPVRWVASFGTLLPLLGIFLVFGLTGNIPGTVWVLYGQDRFTWDPLTVGASLAVFGLFHAGAQAVLTGPLTAWLGEYRTMIVGIVFDSLAFVIIAFATQGWVAFALAPLFALGGVGQPALQSMLTARVGDDEQGRLQGVMASLNSLTSIVGPLVGTAIYAGAHSFWLGTVWVVGAAFYLLAIPLLGMIRPRPLST